MRQLLTTTNYWEDSASHQPAQSATFPPPPSLAPPSVCRDQASPAGTMGAVFLISQYLFPSNKSPKLSPTVSAPLPDGNLALFLPLSCKKKIGQIEKPFLLDRLKVVCQSTLQYTIRVLSAPSPPPGRAAGVVPLSLPLRQCGRRHDDTLCGPGN